MIIYTIIVGTENVIISLEMLWAPNWVSNFFLNDVASVTWIGGVDVPTWGVHLI